MNPVSQQACRSVQPRFKREKAATKLDCRVWKYPGGVNHIFTDVEIPIFVDGRVSLLFAVENLQ